MIRPGSFKLHPQYTKTLARIEKSLEKFYPKENYKYGISEACTAQDQAVHDVYTAIRELYYRIKEYEQLKKEILVEKGSSSKQKR